MIDSSGEINDMTPVCTLKLGQKIRLTNIKAQIIDGYIFETFEMVLASFQVKDKLKRVWFFQKSFLLADISVEVILGIFFLIFSNIDIQFVEKELT